MVEPSVLALFKLLSGGSIVHVGGVKIMWIEGLFSGKPEQPDVFDVFDSDGYKLGSVFVDAVPVFEYVNRGVGGVGRVLATLHQFSQLVGEHFHVDFNVNMVSSPHLLMPKMVYTAVVDYRSNVPHVVLPFETMFRVVKPEGLRFALREGRRVSDFPAHMWDNVEHVKGDAVLSPLVPMLMKNGSAKLFDILNMVDSVVYYRVYRRLFEETFGFFDGSEVQVAAVLKTGQVDMLYWSEFIRTLRLSLTGGGRFGGVFFENKTPYVSFKVGLKSAPVKPKRKLGRSLLLG
jgi:hypothetical protein